MPLPSQASQRPPLTLKPVSYTHLDVYKRQANDCAEDEPDQSKVHFDLHLYEVFAKGYLSTAGASMSMAEKKSLA